jgi:hypothetical protein
MKLKNTIFALPVFLTGCFVNSEAKIVNVDQLVINESLASNNFSQNGSSKTSNSYIN